ncbi:hypothetical protein ROLI_025420 [Roseobacter fucihabitans]|uniref:Thoeris protein ThsB TIR-like domain-containing protein n=1 Tax=Roseobacter fucihabitans TaxID=1537242 RepID=A0ABZ2BTV1_9RHOB|nr:TIR domain-containing protein [Roseobacter litoralis]MBC6967631.1 hypothetical protein [Roseobacter litoralis]
MTKAFVSYHHKNDQYYREHLAQLAMWDGAFEDKSVLVGDIDERLPPQTIRRIIRDNYLRDTEVTILLCGTETRFRKHVDWELKSSMIDGSVNRRSGILVIDLPTTASTSWHAGLPGEKETIYSDFGGGWFSLEHKHQYRERYPDLPERIIDNLMKPGVQMSVVPWAKIENQPQNLKFLVDATARAGVNNEYDTTLPMRMKNHNPLNALAGLGAC